jgi:hypothetical protein
MSGGGSGGATGGQKERQGHGGDQPIAVLWGFGLHARSTQTRHPGYGAHSVIASSRALCLNESDFEGIKATGPARSRVRGCRSGEGAMPTMYVPDGRLPAAGQPCYSTKAAFWALGRFVLSRLVAAR